MIGRDDFSKETTPIIAVCGKYICNDKIHVGLSWIDQENKKTIFHFEDPGKIPCQDMMQDCFSGFIFNPIRDFEASFLPSLSALAELISKDLLPTIAFNRVGISYDGAKFSPTGEFTTKNISERILNCAAFVLAMLYTYDYALIDWSAWPHGVESTPYLENWFAINAVSEFDKEKFYRTAKPIRGKHVIVSPSIDVHPAPFERVEPLANKLVQRLYVPCRPTF